MLLFYVLIFYASCIIIVSKFYCDSIIGAMDRVLTSNEVHFVYCVFKPTLSQIEDTEIDNLLLFRQAHSINE